eukprot:TRINITY_DN2746_c0_g2_i1.p1 TRINITY_DN2746_c0_g2~~TRINITY_DN2746_c0_g2_i1.p1  ORF type:complete len:145 (-),score=67.94 TRINITY_DN2746_c0_g2_i1:59-493(-)
MGGQIKKKKKKKNDDDSESLIRFVPKLKNYVEKAIRGELSTSKFAFVQDIKILNQSPSKREMKTKQRRTHDPVWADRQKRNSLRPGLNKPISRVIVFVIGGITFSELRSIYELAQQYDTELFAGSTEILTTKQYLKFLGEWQAE